MKSLILYIVFLLASQHTFGQTENFKLSYHYFGLGSNMGKHFYPLVKIDGVRLTYTIEENTSISKIEKCKISKRRTIVDTLWNTKTVDFSINLNKETIDTIFNLVKESSDTLIFESNHCIMSGGVDIISISNGSFKVEYNLMNTFDSTALAICNILNNYLPEGNKIFIKSDFMQKRKECDMYFNELRQVEKKRKKEITKQ